MREPSPLPLPEWKQAQAAFCWSLTSSLLIISGNFIHPKSRLWRSAVLLITTSKTMLSTLTYGGWPVYDPGCNIMFHLHHQKPAAECWKNCYSAFLPHVRVPCWSWKKRILYLHAWLIRNVFRRSRANFWKGFLICDIRAANHTSMQEVFHCLITICHLKQRLRNFCCCDLQHTLYKVMKFVYNVSNLGFRFRQPCLLIMTLLFLLIFRLQHHRMCPDGTRSFSGGECSPDQSAEHADGETLLSVTDSDSDLDV